jgi:hypothetical protein
MRVMVRMMVASQHEIMTLRWQFARVNPKNWMRGIGFCDETVTAAELRILLSLQRRHSVFLPFSFALG